MKKAILIFTLLIVSFGLTGCIIRPHVPNVQQGNVIDQKEIDRLKVGMSKDEVRELLGDPVLTTVFDQRCFIYAYTNKVKSKISSKRLTVCFDAAGRLATIQNGSHDAKK